MEYIEDIKRDIRMAIVDSLTERNEVSPNGWWDFDYFKCKLLLRKCGIVTVVSVCYSYKEENNWLEKISITIKDPVVGGYIDTFVHI